MDKISDNPFVAILSQCFKTNPTSSNLPNQSSRYNSQAADKSGTYANAEFSYSYQSSLQ